MESEASDICRNINNDINNGPPAQSCGEDEGKAQKHRGSRCLVSITVSLGLICLLLLIIIILQHFMITAERDKMKSYKNTAEESGLTRYCIRGNYTELTQNKLDLESKNTSLSDKLKKKASKQGNLCALDGFFTSMEYKNWTDSRQFCRDHGADLVIIKSEEKQRLVSSFVKERIGLPVWIGLSDTEAEGNMKWVDNSKLNQGFWMRGEPNDQDGNEDCILLNTKPILKNWNDIPCSIKSNVLCE